MNPQGTSPDPIDSYVKRLAHYRRLAMRARTDLEADLAEWFELPPGPARLVAALYEAGELTHEELEARAEVSVTSFNNLFARARAALGDGAVIFNRATRKSLATYELSARGRLAVEEARRIVGVETQRALLASMLSTTKVAA